MNNQGVNPMKNAKSKYIKLIILDVLFSIIHIVNGIILGESSSLGLIPFALFDLTLQLIYMIIHGITTYCAYRQVFYPHFITGIIIGVSTIFLLTCPDVNKDWVYASSIYLCGFFIISLIISFITMLIFKLHARFRCQEQSGDGSKKTGDGSA